MAPVPQLRILAPLSSSEPWYEPSGDDQAGDPGGGHAARRLAWPRPVMPASVELLAELGPTPGRVPDLRNNHPGLAGRVQRATYWVLELLSRGPGCRSTSRRPGTPLIIARAPTCCLDEPCGVVGDSSSVRGPVGRGEHHRLKRDPVRAAQFLFERELDRPTNMRRISGLTRGQQSEGGELGGPGFSSP